MKETKKQQLVNLETAAISKGYRVVDFSTCPECKGKHVRLFGKGKSVCFACICGYRYKLC